MKRRIRVYVAGPFSAGNVIKVLDNIREGMRLGTELMLMGFAPFVPWFDFHFQLMLRGEEALGVSDYYAYSIAWLEASDVMLVREGWETSSGTLAEIARAEDLCIPVFYTLEALKEWAALESETISQI